MTNPVGTKEQREELRRQMGNRADLDNLSYWQPTDSLRLRTALDGLDIAEEMAKHIEHHPMTASGRCTECKRLSRRWQAWERGER